MNRTETFDYFQMICERAFYDADLCEFGFCGNDEIFFRFVVGGIPIEYLDWVDVNCRGIFYINIIKHPKHIKKKALFIDEAHFQVFEDHSDIKSLLETCGSKVETLPDIIFRFEISGAVEIKVICTEFILSQRKQIFSSD